MLPRYLRRLEHMTSGGFAHLILCILVVRISPPGLRVTGLQTWMQGKRRAKPNAYAVVLVCLALLVLLTAVQVAHVHSVATDADHCPLCIVLHTAAPVAVAAAAVMLVQIDAPAPEFEVRAVTSLWLRQLFIRPPPALCEASFRPLVSA